MEDLDENMDNDEDDIPKEITYKAVLLARSEKQYLYQNNNDELLNIDSFSSEWKSVDDELQYKMKTSNPSQYYKAVTVCPHCYQYIYYYYYLLYFIVFLYFLVFYYLILL